MGHLENNQQGKRRRFLISGNTGKSIKSRIQNFYYGLQGGMLIIKVMHIKCQTQKKILSLGDQKFIAEMVFIPAVKQHVADTSLYKEPYRSFCRQACVQNKSFWPKHFLPFFLVQTLLQPILSQHEKLSLSSSADFTQWKSMLTL